MVVFFGAPLIVWLLLKGEEQCGFPLGAAFLPYGLVYTACRKLSLILPQSGQETEEGLYPHDRARITGTALGRIYIQNHRTTVDVSEEYLEKIVSVNTKYNVLGQSFSLTKG